MRKNGDLWHKSSISYALLVASVPLFIALYIGAILLLPKIGYPEEQYLLYSWFVFPQVPSRAQQSFDARVISVDGIARDEKLEHSDAFLHDELRNVPEYRRRILSIGRHLENGETELARQERLALESFALERPLVYEIIAVTYNPMERFLHGSVIATSSLGVYTAGKL